jgi:hypothetical protein
MGHLKVLELFISKRLQAEKEDQGEGAGEEGYGGHSNASAIAIIV